MSKRGSRLAAVGAIGALALGIVACGDDEGTSTSGSSGDSGEKVKVGLITKTETNPFFVKMKEGAEAARRTAPSCSAAGKKDSDTSRDHRHGEHGRPARRA